jgi:hypothetical protein
MDSFKLTQMVVTLVLRVRAQLLALSHSPRCFRRALPAGETRSPRACVNILPFSYHQRIADADILTSHAQPSPRSPLDDDAKGVLYLHHPLTSDIDWQPQIFPQRPSAVDTWRDDLLPTALGCWSMLLTPVVFVRVARRFSFSPGLRFRPACASGVYTACLAGARCLTHWLICYCDTLISYTSRGVAVHTIRPFYLETYVRRTIPFHVSY